MIDVSNIKDEFQNSLKSIFSDAECINIWNQWVVKEIFNMSLIDYYLQQNLLITSKLVDQIRALISHLLNNKPIQYFFGYTYFKGFKISVDENVLIPRPETEELVDLVVNDAQHNQSNHIIDIGTGSGCIAIALKKKTDSIVFAVDDSEKALVKARFNANYHNVDINFLSLDILNYHDKSDMPKFDVIVSNPPYVCLTDVSKKSNIYFEPMSAIFVPDANPLIFYDAICDFGKRNLNPNGRIFFEINSKFGSSLIKLIDQKGCSKVKIHNDFNGKKRFIVVYF